MERIVFLVESLDIRLSCMLNPETLIFNKSTGVNTTKEISGLQNYEYNSSDNTWLEMELLFDTTLPLQNNNGDDVRFYTKQFYKMANKSERSITGIKQPIVRMIWGKGWNQPGIISDIAERLDYFDNSGVPRRSWIKVRMFLIDEMEYGNSYNQTTEISETVKNIDTITKTDKKNLIELQKSSDSTVIDNRLDHTARKFYGSPEMWKIIAAFNNITDPSGDFRGKKLLIPDIDTLRKINSV